MDREYETKWQGWDGQEKKIHRRYSSIPHRFSRAIGYLNSIIQIWDF